MHASFWAQFAKTTLWKGKALQSISKILSEAVGLTIKSSRSKPKLNKLYLLYAFLVVRKFVNYEPYGEGDLIPQFRVEIKRTSFPLHGSVHFADPQSMDYHDGLPKWTT